MRPRARHGLQQDHDGFTRIAPARAVDWRAQLTMACGPLVPLAWPRGVCRSKPLDRDRTKAGGGALARNWSQGSLGPAARRPRRVRTGRWITACTRQGRLLSNASDSVPIDKLTHSLALRFPARLAPPCSIPPPMSYGSSYYKLFRLRASERSRVTRSGPGPSDESRLRPYVPSSSFLPLP